MANMISNNNNNNSIGGGGGSDAEVFNYNSNNLAMHNKPALTTTTNNAVSSSRNNNNNQTNNSSGIGSSLSGGNSSGIGSSLSGGSSSVGGGGVTTLRDVSSFLQTPEANQVILPPGVNPYDHIIDMLRGLDLEDDGILMNQKVKNIETFFCNVVRTEQMLCESMEYINDKALDDQEAALKFAILFSSHNFDSLAMKETKVRSAMIKILETNFLNADTYRQYDKNRLYNSITLLGEYYHRVRLANNTPINILGESLLTLLIREFEETPAISVKLAKLILSQITLNGDNMRKKHKDELTQLLFHIRRNLIEQPNLKAKVKALLLMTLDLYYCNFKNIGKQLEEMYRKYLVQVDDEQDDEEEAAAAVQVAAAQSQRESVGSTQSQQQKDQLQSQKSVTNSFENGDLSNSSSLNDYNDVDTSLSGGGKKWSEQVCEDSFYEQEYSLDNLNNSGSGPNDPLNTSFSESGHHQRSSSSRSFDQYEGDRESIGRDSRRSYQFRTSPRPLKKDYSEERQDAAHWQNDGNNPMMSNGNGDMPEDRDQTKPLPRWRNTRFNRDGKDQQQQRGDRQHYQGNRRYSQQYDDDRQSERSEGGSIRLYSINDRLKHSQEKFDRNNMSYNIANWDRHSQRDDRSERSYLSNYERGSSRRGARHYNNNRQNYDKPPRFQKQSQSQQQQQQQQQQQPHHQQQNRGGDQKIQSETWRRSGGGGGHNYREHQNNNGPVAYRSNGGGAGQDDNESQRSSSRARTLPRPAKSKIDGGDNSYHQQQQRHHQQRGGVGGQRGGQQHHHNNRRYGSQNSLTSEGSNTLERRQHHNQHRGGGGGGHHNYRNRSQDWNDDRHGGSTHSLNRADRAPSSVSDKNWQGHEGPAVGGGGGIASDEVVREAQQTTKYMNYLSSKK